MKSLERYSNVLICKGAMLPLLFFQKNLALVREQEMVTAMRGIFFISIEFLCMLFTSEGIYNIDLFLRIHVRYVPYPLCLQQLIRGQLWLGDLMLNYSEE